jgi:hypothetical protein
MKYNCIMCIYETSHKGHYNAHLISKIHIEKVNNCAKEYNILATNLSEVQSNQHEQILNNNQKTIDLMVAQKEIDMLKIQLNDKEKQLTDKEKQIIDLLSKIPLPGVPSSTVNNINFNMSSINFLKANYSNAPLLEPMNDYEYLHIQNEDFTDEVLHAQSKNKLDKYLSKCITSEYKQLDPNKQSIWNTDEVRQTYTIRGLINKKPNWVIDKKGCIATEKIIQPLLEYIKDDMTKYNEEVYKTINTLEPRKKCSLLKKMECAASIISNIDNSTLATNIVKKMAPDLFLNKIKQEPIKKERIHKLKK